MFIKINLNFSVKKNEHYLSIPQYAGSRGNRFYETHGRYIENDDRY